MITLYHLLLVCMFQEKTSVLTRLEGVTIETIITMVMKLSEATFKPFLFKVGKVYVLSQNETFSENIFILY